MTQNHTPLRFGTSGIRGLVTDMTDLECYINVKGFVRFLLDTGDITTSDLIAVAGDYRSSTPRILNAVAAAITDTGCRVDNCGSIPTPALAYHALIHRRPCVMVTGSHIPDDRNGIKPYKSDGEVLKSDEAAILEQVARVREEEYGKPAEQSLFDASGRFKTTTSLPPVNFAAEKVYIKRYLTAFPPDCLKSRTIILYEHSSVGRDIFRVILEGLGADVIPVARSESFIPVDSENISKDNRMFFKELAGLHASQNLLAIVSADGDGDRPLIIDEKGEFHPGDMTGLIASRYLHADFAAIPISASDGVALQLEADGVPYIQTKIGSPYIIEAMNQAVAAGKRAVAGWEVNGGFLTATDLYVHGSVLTPLPTRDAILPILCVLMQAVEEGITVSELMARLPRRFSQAGLIDNFPVEASRAIIGAFLPPTDGGIRLVEFRAGDILVTFETENTKRQKVGTSLAEEMNKTKSSLELYFSNASGYKPIVKINYIDGIRFTCENGDVGHLRPSGNAPQFRFYAVADTQQRADEMVQQAVKEPDGILRKIEKELSNRAV